MSPVPTSSSWSPTVIEPHPERTRMTPPCVRWWLGTGSVHSYSTHLTIESSISPTSRTGAAGSIHARFRARRGILEPQGVVMRVTETEHHGQSALVIATASAVWTYQPEAGGFSSLRDP